MPAVAELLTVAEAARRLKQSQDTIRRKIATGALEAVRLGEHGPLRVPEEAIAEHLRPASSARASTDGSLLGGHRDPARAPGADREAE
jgi:excisionase family DNA binding protein